MQLSCEIVQDLILLYVDDACSAGSRKAVEDHLAQCPACRQYLQAIQQPDIAVRVNPEPEPVVQERVMKNGFRKLRRRWQMSVLSVFLLFPLLLLTVLGINEYRREGIAFTNLDDIMISQRFMNLIKAGRFEAAADLYDFENKYFEIQSALELTPEDYMPHYELCMIDGKPWAASSWMAEQYQLQDLCENEDSDLLWTYLILNHCGSLLIPEDVWTHLRPAIENEIPQTRYPLQEEVYSPVDTVWGRFYVYYTIADELEQKNEITAENLIYFINFMPYEIYQEAREGLELKALAHYQETQARYAFMADFTLDEYVQYMKEQFIQALEICYSNGYTIQNPHYSDAYLIEQNWDIHISATQQFPTGESCMITYDFQLQNGKLHTTGGSSLYPMTDPIHDALWLHFPEP